MNSSYEIENYLGNDFLSFRRSENGNEYETFGWVTDKWVELEAHKKPLKSEPLKLGKFQKITLCKAQKILLM